MSHYFNLKKKLFSVDIDSVNNRNQTQFIIAGFLVVSSIVLTLFYFIKSHPDESADFSSYSTEKKELSIVNQHLKRAAEDLNSKKNEVIVEAIKNAKPLSEIAPQRTTYNSEDDFFDFDGDPRMNQLAEDLGRTSTGSAKVKSPKDVVYESLNQDIKKREFDDETKKNLARQFVENAKKDGWHVILDDNYRIKSYKRIKGFDKDGSGHSSFEPDKAINFEVIPK